MRAQLEDKVAALEDANRASQSENENLRDLLSRLQEENTMLKRTAFTFTVPRQGATAPSTAADSSISAGTQGGAFGQAGPSTASAPAAPAYTPAAAAAATPASGSTPLFRYGFCFYFTIHYIL